MNEKKYQDAIALLVMGNSGMIEDEEYSHAFEFVEDGDGWNEPFSDSAYCLCEQWEGLSWVQVDRKCTGRSDIWEYVLEWVKHIESDVWKVDDGDVSQDSDAI